MKYDFDTVIDRRNTRSTKWDRAAEIGSDIIPMWVADMDFTSPSPIRDAIIKRTKHGVFGYEEKPTVIFQTVSEWERRRHGWDVASENILLVTGVIYAINAAILALTDPGDEVIIQTPSYHPFFDAVSCNGRVVTENPLKLQNNRYLPDLDQLKAVVSDKTRAVILCNPHNPTGRIWSRRELKALGEFCVERGIWIISDDIHCDLTHCEKRYTPIAAVSKDISDKTLTLISPTKTFNIAGLKIAAAITTSEEIRHRFEKRAKAAGVLSVNTLGIAALEAAYGQCEDWVEQIKPYIAENVQLAHAFFNDRLELPMSMPEATYFAWVDIRRLQLQSPYEFMINQAKILPNDGVEFGAGGEGFLRFNLACPRSSLASSFNRIENAISKL